MADKKWPFDACPECFSQDIVYSKEKEEIICKQCGAITTKPAK